MRRFCSTPLQIFQLTLPVWGATPDICKEIGATKFQLTLPVWGATRLHAVAASRLPISTHAPRVGSDREHTQNHHREPISTHAPRVGSDQPSLTCAPPAGVFQLTLPVWGATFVCFDGCETFRFQLTLPVWGATKTKTFTNRNYRISTHAPRVGSDTDGRSPRASRHDFNSRSPCGERPSSFNACSTASNFNSRSPCGERRTPGAPFFNCELFQLTLPVWGATFSGGKDSLAVLISTHAPRVGSDLFPEMIVQGMY